MGSSILFFSGRSDNDALQAFASSIGLSLVPLTLDRCVPEDPAAGPFCFLSVLPTDKLSPYGVDMVNVSDATDPLIGFLRSYCKGPYLVAGHIYWSNDVPELSKVTRPYYNKLVRWIKKEWEKYGEIYIGPEARACLDKGAEMVNILPGSATLEVIELP